MTLTSRRSQTVTPRLRLTQEITITSHHKPHILLHHTSNERLLLAHTRTQPHTQTDTHTKKKDNWTFPTTRMTIQWKWRGSKSLIRSSQVIHHKQLQTNTIGTYSILHQTVTTPWVIDTEQHHYYILNMSCRWAMKVSSSFSYKSRSSTTNYFKGKLDNQMKSYLPVKIELLYKISQYSTVLVASFLEVFQTQPCLAFSLLYFYALLFI